MQCPSPSASAYLPCLQRFLFRPLNFSDSKIPEKESEISSNLSVLDIQHYFLLGIREQHLLLSPPLFLFHLLSSVSVSAALEKKSPNIGSGVEVAPGLAAAAAHSSSSVSRGSGSLQSRGSGGHLSPPLSSSFSSAAHQGVKKEPMEHQGISSSSRSRGFSPDSHSAVHQYHAAAAAARATPPHLTHPSPYSAYPYPEAAKLPPSLSGLPKDFHLSYYSDANFRTPRWTLGPVSAAPPEV